MSKRFNTIPESEKEEIAKELGIYDKVKTEGWASISSKDCGNIVKKALERTEEIKNNMK